MKYLTRCDIFLYLIGLLMAFANGSIGATHSVILGRLVATLNPYTTDTDYKSKFDDVVGLAISMTILMIIFGYIQSVILGRTASLMSLSLRGKFIKSLLAQDIDYFESLEID